MQDERIPRDKKLISTRKRLVCRQCQVKQFQDLIGSSSSLLSRVAAALSCFDLADQLSKPKRGS